MDFTRKTQFIHLVLEGLAESWMVDADALACDWGVHLASVEECYWSVVFC